MTIHFPFRKPGMAPHNPPAIPDATNMPNSIPNWLSRRTYLTKAVAASAPMISCPSAPMFQMAALNARTQARPVSVIGIAFTIVSAKPYQLPSEPRRISK